MKRRRCICNDCGVDIVKAGEYVMLDLQIWVRLQIRVFGRAITKRKPYRLKAGSNIHGMTAKDLAVIGKARDAGL